MAADGETNNNVNNKEEGDSIQATTNEIGQLSLEKPLEQVDQPKQNDEEEEDDDFGSFSDASFEEFEEPPTSAKQESSSSTFPQSTFQKPEELQAKLEELTNLAFPVTLPPFNPPSNTSILNERSEHLLERLVAQPHLKPYNWNRSSLKRKLLLTLGLPDDTVVKTERVNTFDASGYKVRKFEEFKIDEEGRKKLLSETDVILNDIMTNLETFETLNVLDEGSLKSVIVKYEHELEQVEKLLSCWENEKSRLEEDHKTFESVVENLVGHTQRLRREETMKSLKKEKEKSNRLTSIFKKKVKK